MADHVKLAWPFKPADVAAKAPPHVARDINRGAAALDTAASVFKETLPQVGRGISRAGNALLKPAEKIGPPVLRQLSRAGDYLSAHPRLLNAGLGAAIAAPVLASAMTDSQQRFEKEMTDMNRDPSRTVTASLESFLEKKASETATYGLRTVTEPRALEAYGVKTAAAKLPTAPQPFARFPHVGAQSAMEAAAKGLGGAVIDHAISALGAGIGALKDFFITDPKRKALVESLMQTDPLIHDAISRDPKAKGLVLEAYGTMARFAPSLATDINAVRSYLREVVLGGSGVNYATIKNLIETERALQSPSKK